MKKLLLVLAAALVMVACKKGNEPENPTPDPGQKTDTIINNAIYDQFSEIIPLYGAQTSVFVSTLKKAGYIQYDPTLFIFGKINANTRSEVQCDTTAAGTISKITFSIFPYDGDSTKKYESEMTDKLIKDFVKKVSNNFELGVNKTNCRFLASYTALGQKVCSSPSDFDTYFNAGNMKGSKTYYLDSKIQTWAPPTQGQTASPYSGAIMGIQEAAQVAGATETEFSLAFEFKDETQQ